MIKCNIAVLLAERNLKMADVIRDTGIAKTTIRALYYNASKGIQFDTLNTLCTYLNVTPGELIQYYPAEYEIVSCEPLNDADNFKIEFTWTLKGKKTAYTLKSEVNICDQNEEDEVTDLAIYISYPKSLYSELIELPIMFSNEIDNEIVNCILEFYSVADGASISIHTNEYE